MDNNYNDDDDDDDDIKTTRKVLVSQKERVKRVVTKESAWISHAGDILTRRMLERGLAFALVSAAAASAPAEAIGGGGGEEKEEKEKENEKENETETEKEKEKDGPFFLFRREVLRKRSSYRSQDKSKGLYVEDEFVSEADCFRLLLECSQCCYYCRCEVAVIYETVRDGCQWTLERLDNTRGHNRDNVVIACLQCNLRRRIMYPQRYLMTKRMINVVKIDN
jgi:hypothetical protein